jgi:iron complex outermembrane receptor protein
MTDVIWHVGDKTNVTTGVRFTQDTKKFSWYNPLRAAPGLDAQIAVFPGILQQMVDAGALDANTAAALGGLAQQVSQSNIEFANPAWAVAPVYTSKTWHNTSPRLVIDHQLTPDTMVFGSVTRGYQAGGFNSVSTDANGGRFDPETITSYELGAKGRVPGAGISYGASLFHYLFKNLQSITLDLSTTVPVYVITVSDVEATGLDGELNWQVASPLRLYVNGEWIDQKYKSQENLAPGARDLTGQPYGTPSLSLAAGVDVSVALAGGKAAWSLQGSHIGATRCNDDSQAQGSCATTPAFKVGQARDRFDTRLGWANDHWGAALIVTNLFDKRYVSGLSNLSAAVGVPYTASVSDPRKFQIEFSAKL